MAARWRMESYKTHPSAYGVKLGSQCSHTHPNEGFIHHYKAPHPVSMRLLPTSVSDQLVPIPPTSVTGLTLSYKCDKNIALVAYGTPFPPKVRSLRLSKIDFQSICGLNSSSLPALLCLSLAWECCSLAPSIPYWPPFYWQHYLICLLFCLFYLFLCFRLFCIDFCFFVLYVMYCFGIT